jgi:thiosulfate dehydrogenase [quinone] large subunit
MEGNVIGREAAQLTRDGAVARGGVAFLRILFGLLWLVNVSWKQPPFDALRYFTSFAVSRPVFAPYSFVVEKVVLPNFTPFGYAVTAIEAALGAFLLIGFATRLWAVVGAVQTVAITLAALHAPNEWSWSYYMLFAGHVVIFATAAGRAFGVDGLLREAWLRSSSPVARFLGKVS